MRFAFARKLRAHYIRLVLGTMQFGTFRIPVSYLTTQRLKYINL
jgi:hypothetical protein